MGENEEVMQNETKLNPYEGMSSKEATAKLFANGNKLESGPNGKFPVGSDTQSLLALFSDGTFLVSSTHKFDGRVLSFQSLVRKKGGQIHRPIYVAMSLLNTIYSTAIKTSTSTVSKDDAMSNNQMQKDFVDIVYRAAELKVSDIHVIVADHTTVMFRISGSMQTILEYDKNWGEAFVRSVFASADISDSNYAQNEFQVGQKLGSTPLRGEKDLYLPENILSIRLQFNPIAFGTRYLVMRLLYANSSTSSADNLKELGFSDYEDEKLYRMRSFPTGLCIIAGPTGSGKSTTLQRVMIKMLKEKNYELNLITVEDPPEYPIPGARQMPVTNATTEEEKEDAFNLALAASLRSDPDAIMVGEIRTLSSAELTFKAALSGHNVWSTLHANSAPAIITRLRDMGIQPYMLNDPELVKGLVSQRLFSKLCPVCKQPIKTREGSPEFIRLNNALGEYGVENVYVAGPGCKACGYKGFKGRMAVDEIILPDSKFLRMIIDNETANAIDYWVSELNGRPLKDAAIERMIKGQIDLDEVERWCGLIDQRPVY